MGPFLHVAWLHAADDDARARAYLDAARRATERPSAAYTLVAGGEHIQQIAARLARLAPDDDLDVSPTHVVLTDVADLHGGLTLHRALGTDAPAAALTALFAEVAVYRGTVADPVDGFADAIQLGTFDMPSAEDDWAIADWYEHRRMPAFQAMEGSVRSARLVTVCGGLTRMGVFYQFRSMDERDASFESIEEGDHDPSRPSVAARTIHPRMSPSIGERLEL
jgi:hypothetical protein